MSTGGEAEARTHGRALRGGWTASGCFGRRSFVRGCRGRIDGAAEAVEPFESVDTALPLPFALSLVSKLRHHPVLFWSARLRPMPSVILKLCARFRRLRSSSSSWYRARLVAIFVSTAAIRDVSLWGAAALASELWYQRRVGHEYVRRRSRRRSATTVFMRRKRAAVTPDERRA